MGSKRRRATSPSSSVSGGDFDDGHHSTNIPGPSRKRRRLSNLPTVDPVSTFLLCIHLFFVVGWLYSCLRNAGLWDGMCFLQHMFWLAAHLTVIFSMYTLSSSRPEAGAALAKLCLGSHSPLVCSRFCFSLFPFPFCWFFFFFFLMVVLADRRRLERELK